MKTIKSISLDEKLLADIDSHIDNSVFQDRSSYFCFLAERDLYKYKLDKKLILLVVVLMQMSIITILLLLKVI